MMRCTECFWSNGSDCRDSLFIGSRGSLEIHSVIEEENGPLLSFWSLWGIISRKEEPNHHGSRESYDSRPGLTDALMGRSNRDSCVCVEPKSSPGDWEQNPGRGILRGEIGSQPSPDIWLSYIHTCSQGEKDEAGTVRKERDIYCLQWDIESLQDIYP